MISSQSNQFQEFLFEMGDVLEALVEEAQFNRVVLDYTLESLDGLEKFIDISLNQDLQREQKLVNRAARYFGETFIRLYGGKWNLFEDEPRHLYSGLPVVSEFSANDYSICPIVIVTNYIKRKKPGTLRKAVVANKEFIKNR